jgi:hypothetical protein
MILQNLRRGYYSVMYDGAHLPLDENIAGAAYIVKIAHVVRLEQGKCREKFPNGHCARAAPSSVPKESLGKGPARRVSGERTRPRVQFPASRRKTLFGETPKTTGGDAYAPQTAMQT